MQKYEELKDYLLSLGSVAVAFSGGVDSTFLLYAAKEALKDEVLAVTVLSSSFPERERKEAEEYCQQEQIRQVALPFDELEVRGFAENPRNRCYLCKRELFQNIQRIAKQEQKKVVIEGSNLDDLGDYRPGLLAIEELGVKSPLRELGFTKEEIRFLSKELGLPTWAKPSFACLSTRIPYGEKITKEKLNMVAQAEQILFDLGLRQCRVRMHGTMARIEILSEDFVRFLEEKVRKYVVWELKKLGFSYVSLDLLGYRSGSMNEVSGTEINF